MTVVTNISCAQELFYLLPMDSEPERRTLLSLVRTDFISPEFRIQYFPQVGSLKAIPAHLDVLYQKALEEGYQNYVKSGRFHGF